MYRITDESVNNRGFFSGINNIPCFRVYRGDTCMGSFATLREAEALKADLESWTEGCSNEDLLREQAEND